MSFPSGSPLIGVFDTEVDCYAQIKESFLAASDIKLLLIDGHSMIGHQYALLYELLDSKVAQVEKPVITIRVLLLSSRSESFINAETAKMCGQTDSEIRGNIEFGIKTVLRAKNKYEGTRLKIHLKLYDELPVWKLIILDDIAFVRGFLYLEGFTKVNTPMYRFQRAGGALFAAFVKYFDYLWNYKSFEVELFD